MNQVSGFILCLLVSGIAQADIAAQIAQLKKNLEASKENLAQYEANLKTVATNISEVESANKELDKQKNTIKKQIADAGKNKNGNLSAKKILENYLVSENKRYEYEKAQLAELQKLIVTLEQNQRRREENIAAYKARMQQADRSIASVGERNKALMDLDKELDGKRGEAAKMRKELLNRRGTYEREIAYWKKELRTAEREYRNYSKLKD